ncbi:hypothetical protein FIBSPDRAFT_932927 [Athelia psychrophila]|uniref:Uncharacterized protein n=1 Tax=Athelia psychrophila TaxID=1759441 RepID=A0A166I0M6_9AGAM|nr:hypothetical protein FIBSPDRAFT_932927 [Fibularhizoctonia sp. CBS 109695]
MRRVAFACWCVRRVRSVPGVGAGRVGAQEGAGRQEVGAEGARGRRARGHEVGRAAHAAGGAGAVERWRCPRCSCPTGKLERPPRRHVRLRAAELMVRQGLGERLVGRTMGVLRAPVLPLRGVRVLGRRKARRLPGRGRARPGQQYSRCEGACSKSSLSSPAPSFALSHLWQRSDRDRVRESPELALALALALGVCVCMPPPARAETLEELAPLVAAGALPPPLLRRESAGRGTPAPGNPLRATRYPYQFRTNSVLAETHLRAIASSNVPCAVDTANLRLSVPLCHCDALVSRTLPTGLSSAFNSRHALLITAQYSTALGLSAPAARPVKQLRTHPQLQLQLQATPANSVLAEMHRRVVACSICMCHRYCKPPSVTGQCHCGALRLTHALIWTFDTRSVCLSAPAARLVRQLHTHFQLQLLATPAIDTANLRLSVPLWRASLPAHAPNRAFKCI